MLFVLPRIVLTILAIIDILIDCYNTTVEWNDGRIHIEINIFTVIFTVAVWFI
jgi:hypothetical protein